MRYITSGDGRRWAGTCRRAWVYIALMVLLGALVGCGQSSGNSAYGGPQNHVHDLLALRGFTRTVLLATHYGLYRTTNAGGTWTEVAGSDGQPMDGLMIFKLAQSPVDSRRVYVLAIPRTGQPDAAKGIPGLYTSANAGQTWTLASSVTALPTHTIFSIGAGSAAPGQVYTLIPALGEHGFYVTQDFGARWSALPPLPDSHPTGVMGDPNHPGRVLLWSASSGFYASADGGRRWTRASGIQGGIFSVSVAGSTLYASGDAGTYVSADDGGHFILANGAFTFSSVSACPAVPTHAYALTGTTIYVSTDGARTWRPTATTSSHPGGIAVDPANANLAYTSFSYPIGVDATTDGGARWNTVLP